MTDLKQILESYHMDALRAMARYHSLEVMSSAKASHVNGLARVLSRPETVKRALADLSPLERRAVALVQLAGGEAHSNGLKQTLLRAGVVKETPTPGQSRQWSPSYGGWFYEGKPDYKGTPCYEDLMGRLALHGLVFSREPLQASRNVIQWTPGRIVFIPPAIARQLPDLTSALDEKKAAIAEPSQVLAGSARAFQRDLGRFWRYIRSQGELRLTTQGYVYKADLKAINETLGVTADLSPGQGEADNGRLYFIRRLLPDLKLVNYSQSGNLEPVPDTDFLGLSPAERVKRTFEAWRDGGGWNELLHLSAQASGYHHTHQAPAQLKGIRKKILDNLRELGADGWVALERLIDRIRLRDYGFLFPERQFHSYYSHYQTYYATPYYGGNNPFGITWSGIKDEGEGWEKVEAGLIAHIVAGPLFWMGLVDLGYTAETQPDPNTAMRPLAYRLTDLGAWLLGLGAPVEIPEEGGRVVVQPNFQILAMEPISDEVLINLDRFAEPQGGDRVMTYELTRQSVYKGQRNGWSAPQIIGHLEKVSGAPLPANVRRSLEEWHALHERIVFRRGVTLAQAADSATLDRLLENPEIAVALGDRVLETVTRSTHPVKTAAAALRQQGWLPLITPAGQRQAPDSFRADADGRLRFVHAAPSIYALGRVAPYSEPIDDGWQITRAAVRNALRHKSVMVDTILTDLRSVHAGELPPELILNIKAWGKHYGDATMDTLTLVEFRDLDVLRELLADPELKPYLQPFQAGRRALATVDREHLDTVQRLLAERGIEIKWGLD
jgi:hypothetical protein